MKDTLQWLQNWYLNQCNELWEHQYGIRIVTIDNPGWKVTIDVRETPLEHIEVEYCMTEVSDGDWYTYEVKEGLFKGYGDPSKLQVILEKFREIVEANPIST